MSSRAKAWKTFACMGDVSLELTNVAANTARAFASLRRELDGIGIVAIPAKTVPPKGHAPMAE